MLNKDGLEVPDKTKMALPVGFRRPESVNSMIQRFVRRELSHAARNIGKETFDEANDFDIPGEPDIRTPYEEAADNVVDGIDVDPSAVGPGLDAVRSGLADAPPKPKPGFFERFKPKPKAPPAPPVEGRNGGGEGGRPNPPAPVGAGPEPAPK